MNTLTCDIFKVKYIIADFKPAFYAESKNHSHFSNQIKFLKYMLLLEMYGTVLYSIYFLVELNK